MCTLITALTTGASLYSGIAQSRNARAQAEAQARALEANARNSEIQAHDAIERGGQEELRLRRNLAQVAGNQRVQAASSGIDVNSGSAVDARNASISEGERDAEAIRFNAARERWGYMAQANNLRNQAANARAQGKAAADNILFGTVANVGLGLAGNIYNSNQASSPLTDTDGGYGKYWEPPNWDEAYRLAQKSYKANRKGR